MDNTDLIEAALTSGQAFVLPPSTRTPLDELTPQAPSDAPQPSEPTSTPAEASAEPTTDAWKQEYDAQVEAWKAQSAEAREKAEKERERWETIRKDEAAQRKAAGIPQDTSDIPTGLPSFDSPSKEPQPSEVRPDSRQDTNDGSQKWEDVQASTSSFPSMTFPDQIETPSPPRQTQAPQPVPPTSATLSIFDPSLSTRTRVIALFSSLAINLALPFVNGVMLGFGEIFAKNVVMGWFGWKPIAPIASNVGISSSRKGRDVFHK